MIESIFENKNEEILNETITKKANLIVFTSSIFFPAQINIKLLNKVAVAYTEPNCP